MSKKIWRFTIQAVERQTIKMPALAHILDCQRQSFGALSLWAIIDPAQAQEDREIAIIGAGHPMPDDLNDYIATVQDGELVWHVFDVRRT